MRFQESEYLHDLEQVQGDLCAYCGFMTGFRKSPGYECCCLGCSNETGCTCDPIAAVATHTAAPAPAAAPANGLTRPQLACQSCRRFVANTDGGFETCCQGCTFGACTCTPADLVNGNTIMSLADFQDAEAAWSDADHTQMVQDNSTPAPVPSHKKLTRKQVKGQLKRCANGLSGFCAICHSTDNDPACKLKCCGQRFHVECVERWLTQEKASCPTCNCQFE